MPELIKYKNTSAVPYDVEVSADNPLPVTLVTSGDTNESTVNTTTTPLGSGETFTGTFEQNTASDVVVSCITDNPGTLYFDFSNDGTNVDTFPVGGFRVAAGIHEFHSAVKAPRFFRVRLVNDSGAQSYLRLYTYFGTYRQGNLPLNATIGNDADAIVVRTLNPEIDLAVGRVGGMEQVRRFGYATGLGTAVQEGTPSTWVDLWSYGGLRTVPSSSFTPYMASDDAGDTGIEVTWVYQDTDGNEQTVTVNTDGSNGQTPVSLGVTATELYRGWISGGSEPSGDIAVAIANNFTSGAPDTQSEVLAQIPAGDNQTQLLAGRIPANKTGVPQELQILIARANGSDGSALGVFQMRASGGVWRTFDPLIPTTGTPDMTKLKGVTLPALSDWRVRIRDVSDTGTFIKGDFIHVLVDD